MDIKILILERVVKWLVGGALFEFVVETVEAVNNSTITNEEKRAYVLKKAKEMFTGAFTVFINLAIEVGVIMLKQRIEDAK